MASGGADGGSSPQPRLPYPAVNERLRSVAHATTLQRMARAARNASTRSGGHFAVIGISQLGTPAFFCTHADGELAELWRDPDLQQWLRQRNEALFNEDPAQSAPEAPDDDAATVSARSPAYKTLKGLGKLKKHLASHGIVTVQDLAWASDTTLAAVIPKLGKSKTLQQAVQRAREIAGSSDPAAASLPAADTPVPAATADAMATGST